MAEPIRHLYFHIPFCPKLCPYCSFFVQVGSANKNQDFLDALLLDVEQASRHFEIKPQTIYFGGGTPSALRTEQLDYLFTALRKRLDFTELEEWDLEANPATIRPEKARRLHELGVTRLSLGVQSWDDDLLKTLGRVHSAAEAERTFHILRDAGFTNLNIDLMFAVPGQSDEQWQRSLDKSIRLGSEHVSTYCLTYEEDTEYFRKLGVGEFTQNEERDARLFERTIETLESAGLCHYEISNYARPGFESRHNLAYWLGADYLGFGPSAFSTVGLDRWQNIPNTVEYIRRIRAGESGGEFREALSSRTRDGEILAFGLRTARGVKQSAVAPWRDELAPYFEHGLVIEEGDRIRLTPRGKLLADSVAEVFVGS